MTVPAPVPLAIRRRPIRIRPGAPPAIWLAAFGLPTCPPRPAR